MTGIRAVALGLRFLAIWCLLVAIQSVGVVFAVQDQDHSQASRWWAVVPVVALIAIAALLWKFAPIIARNLYDPGLPDEKIAISADSALRVGCCLLGLAILPKMVFPTIMLVEEIIEWAHPADEITAMAYLNQAIEVGLYGGLAWALIFKSKFIARYMLKHSE